MDLCIGNHLGIHNSRHPNGIRFQRGKPGLQVIAIHAKRNDSRHDWGTTVDGRNPAPVDVVDIPVFIGFYTSQVVQDSFHQQYVNKTSMFFSGAWCTKRIGNDMKQTPLEKGA